MLPYSLGILSFMAEIPDSMQVEMFLSMSVSDKSSAPLFFSGAMFVTLHFLGLVIPVADLTTWDLIPLAPFLEGMLLKC